MTKHWAILAAMLAACLLAPVALAADAPGRPQRPAPAEDAQPAADSITQHEIDASGQRLAYTATAGTLPVTVGESKANIFYTAYVVAPAGKPRPITFVFNGGPGAASAFLNIGAIGPRVVPFNDNGSGARLPVHLIDNPDTWITFTDLVFLDPADTGYSKETASGGGGGDQRKSGFFGVESDAASIADAVRLYLTRNGRSLDPVFLTGESYGGYRAAVLCKQLLQAGYDVRGAVLVSPALEFSLIANDDLLLLPQALALPSIAYSHFEAAHVSADAQPSPQDLIAFARGPYLTHLAGGTRDDPAIDAVLARDTGLLPEKIARRGGRVSVHDYLVTEGRDKDRTVSRYDGSVSVPAPRPAGEWNSDPVLDYAVAALNPAFVTYAREELGYKTDADYQLLNHRVSREWDFGSSPQHQGYAGALDDLEAARTQRPSLRILIASGKTDLVTPFAGEQFLVDQLPPLDGAVPVELKVYDGGHMMYLRAASRAALAADARALFAEGVK